MTSRPGVPQGDGPATKADCERCGDTGWCMEDERQEFQTDRAIPCPFCQREDYERYRRGEDYWRTAWAEARSLNGEYSEVVKRHSARGMALMEALKEIAVGMWEDPTTARQIARKALERSGGRDGE